MCLVGMVAFAQTSLNEVVYCDGNTYTMPQSFQAESGAAIFVPVPDFTAGTMFWDLKDYRGLELSFTCDEADLNSTMPLRLVMVDTSNANVLDVVETITFTETVATVVFDFSDDIFKGSKKMWAVKISGYSGTETFLNNPVTINYINALPKLEYTPLSDLTFSDNNTYEVVVDSFEVKGGEAIFVPYWDFSDGTMFYDLSEYEGIQFSFNCDLADVDSTFALRLVMVDPTNNGVLNFVNNVTFDDTTVIVNYDLSDANFKGSTKIWGIKVQSAISSFNNKIKTNSILLYKAKSPTTSIEDVKYIQSQKQNLDPNRLVEVYSISGAVVRHEVPYVRATEGLERGIYIIDREKVFVSKPY